MSPFERDLPRHAANYAPLSPLSFIARTAYVWPERVAVIHGARRYTWRQAYDRSRRLASALARRGIGAGREGGPEGLQEYLETKYVAMNVA